MDMYERNSLHHCLLFLLRSNKLKMLLGAGLKKPTRARIALRPNLYLPVPSPAV